MMKKTTVIFDWNGTLIDDLELCLALLNSMLKKRGLAEYDVAGYREIFTFPVIDYYRKAGFDFKKESFDELSVEFMDQYVAEYKKCPLVPNCEAVLAKLHDRGVSCVVLSATKQDYLEEQIAAFNLTGHFDDLVGIRNIKAAGKIERAKQWMKDKGLNPDECIMVGDSIHDSEVARELGIDCLLITSGHQSRKRLETCHRPVIDDLAQILDYVE